MLPQFASFLDREPVTVPTIVIHGMQDTVVPREEVRETTKKVFSNLISHSVDDDHRLHAAID